MEKDEKTQVAEPTPEELLAEVRSVPEMTFSVFAATSGQMPVEITGYRGDEVPDPEHFATPVDAVDGGDGSHTTAQSKVDDYVWKPFVAPESWPSEEDFNEEGTIWNDTPATQTQVSANDTATVAANALTKY